jgi:hypothetical protein
MLTFLDSVLDMDDGEYAKVAMLDCIHHANAGHKNWFARLLQLVKHCAGGVLPPAVLQHDGTVDVENCLLVWRQYHYHTVWNGLHPDPRTAPSENVTLCTYHSYFATDIPEDGGVWSCAPCIAASNIPYHQLISLINMRTNSLTMRNLNIERMRHLRPRVPRAHRLCPWCRAPGTVQDELHCILECPHVAHIRLQYPLLFNSEVTRDMRMLFTDESLSCALASYVHRTLKACDTADSQA